MSRITTSIALGAATAALSAGVGLSTAAPAAAAAPRDATVLLVPGAATVGAVPVRRCSFSEAFQMVQALDDYYTGIWAPGIFYYWVGVYMHSSWMC